MNTETSLWGNLPLDEVVRTPLIILREQATILTKATNGLLTGVVSMSSVTEYDLFGNPVRTAGHPPVFRATLDIEAPALDGYVFQVLQAEFSLVAYPVKVQDLLSKVEYNCSDVDEFNKALSTVLSSIEVRRAIGLLLAQSRSERQAA